jgi:hypothetical protein
MKQYQAYRYTSICLAETSKLSAAQFSHLTVDTFLVGFVDVYYTGTWFLRRAARRSHICFQLPLQLFFSRL